jgi:hypothetical protein
METTFTSPTARHPLLINRPYINLEETDGFFRRFEPNSGGPAYHLYDRPQNCYRSFLL